MPIGVIPSSAGVRRPFAAVRRPFAGYRKTSGGFSEFSQNSSLTEKPILAIAKMGFWFCELKIILEIKYFSRFLNSFGVCYNNNIQLFCCQAIVLYFDIFVVEVVFYVYNILSQ
jgi:hypothetical protein